MTKRRDYAIQLGDQKCWKMGWAPLCACTEHPMAAARYTYAGALAVKTRMFKADPDIAVPLCVVKHPAGPEPEQ
jgi:hypothetical protein